MADLQLVNYIKRHLEKGYTKRELENILSKNNWNKNEVKQAFRIIETKKKMPKPVQKQKNSEKKITQPNFEQINTLKNFIISIRARKVDDAKIREALSKKKWPEKSIDLAFSELKKENKEKPSQKTFVKPAIQKKPRQPFNFKKLLPYLIGIIVLTIVLTGTIFISQYVVGLSTYEIKINGMQETGKCKSLDCSDMKNFAFNHANEKLILYFGISIIVSLLMAGLYAFEKIRTAALWGANLLYFGFLIFIAYTWMSFI
ncbi:hypothetical protein HON86_01655 [Candidatus Woesearchaeota archaeon]|jgi:hypothetical protein|nr:hypothetical protein [Candidatus Woesearchaeota archaeon]MBT4835307.1 hypothetical protein [Candidatus Woesearchaeota archaeon]MBT6734767.1 hypothetical protein [Candidatus Woesearchaeota archaeon]MBT7169554.1 hypothetical protein [Candidatus Woesearchaeota archaeon]MBT7474356.1 hypothetical protein [Candidatus Woesearchaeota archaeon]